MSKNDKNNQELINIELDGLPPTVNHMHINARGRRFRTNECIAYQDYGLLKSLIRAVWL